MGQQQQMPGQMMQPGMQGQMGQQMPGQMMQPGMQGQPMMGQQMPGQMRPGMGGQMMGQQPFGGATPYSQDPQFMEGPGLPPPPPLNDGFPPQPQAGYPIAAY